MKQKGFTIIELLVVISIVALLASVILVALQGARVKARVAAAVQNQRQLQKIVDFYVGDIGFYPPDVGRGTDPGFSQPLANNTDTGLNCNTSPADCPVCPAAQCPADWISQVQAKWNGPYIAGYPNTTPWGGEYDFNYWPVGATRYGCTIPPGVYIGVQGDYSNGHLIPPDAEQQMLDQNLDGDGCLNGEAQMILHGL